LITQYYLHRVYSSKSSSIGCERESTYNSLLDVYFEVRGSEWDEVD